LVALRQMLLVSALEEKAGTMPRKSLHFAHVSGDVMT